MTLSPAVTENPLLKTSSLSTNAPEYFDFEYPTTTTE